MKQTLITLVILIATTTFALAQHEDSIRITTPSIPVLPFVDSLRTNKDAERHTPTMYKPTNPEVQLHLFSDTRTTFKLDKKQKEKHLFNATYTKLLVPIIFISYGVLAQESGWLKELDRSTHHEVSEHINKRVRIDDYTQFAPAIAVFGLDWSGITAKNNYKDRAFVLGTSHLFMFASVQILKNTTNVKRPDGSNYHSFPSGHTATAFAGAHILFKEYSDTSPLIGVTGYALAAGTGIMRIYNKKHWISDVVAGAGISILSVEVSYMLLPIFHQVFKVKDTKKSFSITPAFSDNNYGATVIYSFSTKSSRMPKGI